MQQADILVFFEHLYWMRDRVLDAADDDSIEWTGGPHPTLRDLRATLVHELDVQWSWRERLAGADPTSFGPEDDLKPANYPTLDALRGHWSRDEAQMRQWLGSLADDRLNERCRAEADAGHPFWYHLQHLYTHGMQQFSDAAVLLTQAGRSPGEIDFLEFVRDRGERPT